MEKNRMQYNEINTALEAAQQSLRKAVELISRIQKNRPLYSPDVLSERLWIITHEMEVATNKMRHASTMSGHEPEFWGGEPSESCEMTPLDESSNEIPDNSCRIALHEHWYGLKINMPLLAANRRRADNSYYADMLNDRLKIILGNEKPYRFGRCVVVFENIYVIGEKKQPHLDPDNVEIQGVMNVLSKYFIKDDNALQCSLLITAGTGRFPVTHIYIVSIDEFPRWISRRQKALLED